MDERQKNGCSTGDILRNLEKRIHSISLVKHLAMH